MNGTKHSYGEYIDSSKLMFKLLFGEEMYKKLNSEPLTTIEWKGLDITSCQILATFPNIKERFNKEWIESFSEKKTSLFELFLQVVFHYGYQQSYEYNKATIDTYKKLGELHQRMLEDRTKDEV